MLHVTALNERSRDEFCRLFDSYYKELDCDDDTAHLLDEYVLPDCLAGLIRIYMIYENDEAAGFVIFQIDDIDNDWNLKEGWGDIREIYISPSHRRKGLGKFLLYSAEMFLKENGADRAYCLPYKKAEQFFTDCGYKKTDVYNGDFDCFVYEKLSLENCECKKSGT